MPLSNTLPISLPAAADPRLHHRHDLAHARLSLGFSAQRFPTMGCEFKTAGSGITATVTSSIHDMTRAGKLVEQQYLARGYTCTHVGDTANLAPRNETVMVATQGGEIVGTMTMAIDGPYGLWMDHTYPDIAQAARARRRMLCELTRLAVVAGTDTRGTLIALFALAHQVGYGQHGVEEVFIEVNPRHRSFYCRSFGFKAVSDVRTCDRVNAPAILLRLDVEQLNLRLQDAQAVCA